MNTSSWTKKEIVEKKRVQVLQWREDGYGYRRCAKRLTEDTGRNCCATVMQDALRILEKASSVVDISKDEEMDQPIEELIRARIRASRRKRAKANLHHRTLELDPEPFGVVIFGDPHVDNEGCDWDLLQKHVELVQSTPNCYGVCQGDMQDNWIGRLQKMYANSSMKASDAWRLSRWLLEQITWVAVVGGNHDAWAHAPGVDPLGWVSKEANVLAYAPDELRLTLTWRGRPDLEPLIWVIRHDFKGRSMYHPTHGVHKEAQLDGQAHLLTAGHLHQWGELTTEQRHGRVTHSLRVRGYKRNDAYAREKGFPEQEHGAAVFVLFRPCADPAGRIQTFWDVSEGAEYLTQLLARS